MKNDPHIHKTKKKTDSNVHQPEIQRVITKKNLVNILNYMNFQGKSIVFHFCSDDGINEFPVDIKPLPVYGDYLSCLWPDELSGTQFPVIQVSIPHKNDIIELVPEIRARTPKGICIRLPETCLAMTHPIRMNRSFEDIRVRIEQNSTVFSFEITDIRDNKVTMVMRKNKSDESPIFENGIQINASFVKHGKIIYDSRFNLTRLNEDEESLQMDIELPSQSINCYPPKKFRSSRYNLKPTPDVFFTHPFTGKYVCMDVCDISGTGFSIIDEDDSALLLTGMVIRNIELRFPGAIAITCDAQIVHRNNVQNLGGPKMTRTGFAIIGITMDNHLRLQSIFHQTDNPNTRICNPVDSDDLWDFFFETGFIYSNKYRAFTGKENIIKDIYRKLYNEPNPISRHFTYQEKGKILGHMSMLHFYADSWLIHHHAALKKSSIKAGLAVLNQVTRYLSDSQGIESCHMKFVHCYFRPDNTFPNFFFNGFKEKLNNKKGCSTDTFAYYTLKKYTDRKTALPQPWKLDESTALDLEDLDTFYKRHSGGLLIDALDLSPDSKPHDELNALYRTSGFKKERRIYSLRHKGDLAAVILVNITDIAINMSELTNCITVMVMDEARVTSDILSAVLDGLSSFYSMKRFPVLLYPQSFAESRHIPYQKQYILWILATQYMDHYFEYLNQVNALGIKHN